MTESIEPTAEDEEAAAAEEAGAIGGEKPGYGSGDPAEQAVAEGGGGEAEGFEQSEAALRHQAENIDEHRSPLHDQITPEAESDEAGVEYGEADDSQPDDAA